jgi:Ca2+-transporting ATPase
MAVSRLAREEQQLEVGDAAELPEDFHELVEFAILASQRTPFDPMEQAIRDFGLRTLARTEHLHEDWELLREYPLSPELLAVSHAWKARDREDFVVAAKGVLAVFELILLDDGESAQCFVCRVGFNRSGKWQICYVSLTVVLSQSVQERGR